LKLIIFGATGTLGRHLVVQALAQGHTVTAFSRHPASINFEHQSLRGRAGNVLDVDSVMGAVQGHDAVLIALGAGHKGIVRSMGTRHIVTAMQAQGIRKLVCMSSLGAGDSRPVLNFFWKHIMFGFLLKKAMDDHNAQEAIVRRADIDWTIARPAAFTNGEATGEYKHGDLSDSARDGGKLKFKISRADVAGFLLKQLSDDRYLRQTPGLSY